MYAEFTGLTNDVVTLIERLRLAPEETKSDILRRVLAPLAMPKQPTESSIEADSDLGQGVRLPIGQKLFLFLSKESKRATKPDGMAEIRVDGLYLGGKKIHASPRRALDPAMKLVQKQLGHFNERGEVISHSAWRDWHVLRDGRFISLFELKDPKLARKRGRKFYSSLTLEELGLA